MEFTKQGGPKYFRWQVGCDTDIGGSKENQDDYFVYECKEKGVIVLCILDGHGRDVGKAAAETVRILRPISFSWSIFSPSFLVLTYPITLFSS